MLWHGEVWRVIALLEVFICFVDSCTVHPLTLTVSPEDGGEGTGEDHQRTTAPASSSSWPPSFPPFPSVQILVLQSAA